MPVKHLHQSIRIVSPSGCVDPEYVDGAIARLRSWGWEVSEGVHVRGVYGRYAGTAEERLADLQQALDDPSLTAILCSRGGYGLTQLVDKLNFTTFRRHPKWLIGFSDVTVLHNLISNLRLPSLHAVMAKQLATLHPDTPTIIYFKQIIEGYMPAYHIGPVPENQFGKKIGRLVGGNLSVLHGLRGTPYDLNYQKAILFIEEIGEDTYHIDRMLHNLKLGGVFRQLSGLIVGHISNCPEDPSMKRTIRQMILDAVDNPDLPVCFDFPSGHEDSNYPLVMGRKVNFRVSVTGCKLDFN